MNPYLKTLLLMPVGYGYLENNPVLSKHEPIAKIWVITDASEIWLLGKQDCFKNHEPIPRIRVKGNHLPYITSDLRKMSRQRDYLRAKVNKTDSSVLRQAFNPVKYKVT